MKILYVIGNGFDIYHNLDTRYQSFALFLAERYNEIYELLLQYYSLPDITDPAHTEEEYALWSRFEAALSDLDYQSVLEDNSDYAASPGFGEWSDSQWHDYQIQMESITEQLTTDLIEAFSDFVLDLDYSVAQANPALQFDEDAHYLNFNYTESLQYFYGVVDEKITYIHEKAGLNDSLILGHGTDPSNFLEPEVKAPEGLTPEEYDDWRQQKSNEWDFSTDAAKQVILGYYTTAFKNCQKIITEKEEFFSSLAQLEKIIVLGHSLSDVDIKYFQKIKSVTDDNLEWQVSYYGDHEKEQHMRTLLEWGVPKHKINQILISDLCVNCATD